MVAYKPLGCCQTVANLIACTLGLSQMWLVESNWDCKLSGIKHQAVPHANPVRHCSYKALTDKVWKAACIKQAAWHAVVQRLKIAQAPHQEAAHGSAKLKTHLTGISLIHTGWLKPSTHQLSLQHLHLIDQIKVLPGLFLQVYSLVSACSYSVGCHDMKHIMLSLMQAFVS